MMKKRIALLGNTASTLLNFRYELIQKLLSEGHDVFCLVNSYTTDEKERIDSLGATVKEVTLNSKGINPLSDLVAIWQLRKQLKRINPDIFFAYFVKPVIFGTFAARLAGVKRCVGMIEGLGNAFTLGREGYTRKAKAIQQVQIWLYKMALPRLDRLIVLNNDDKKELIERYDIDVDTVVLGGIGVDLDKFAFAPIAGQTPLSFIFVARLLREKGVFEYLQAASELKAKYPDVAFRILGDVDEGNPFALRQDALDPYIVKGIVEYAGFVADIRPYLAASSVFVLPSYREGVPRSTQEAMAIGRAIITTDVPGCRDTVENGYNGLMINPHDSQALAEAMETFIQQPELVHTMGRASREMAERNYDVHRVNQRLMAILIGEG